MAPPRGAIAFCCLVHLFFFQAEDGIRYWSVTGVQTCALPILTSLLERTRPLEQAGHLDVPGRVPAQREVQIVDVLEQAGQLGVELGDRKRFVGTVVAGGALDARPATIPDLALGIARTNEQQETPLPSGSQKRHRVRLVEAGQIPEIAVLPEAIAGIAIARPHGRARQEHERARTDLA